MGTDTEGHTKMEAKIGVMQPRKLEERHGIDSPSEPPERTYPTNNWILDFQSLDYERINSVVSSQPVCSDLLWQP